MPFLTIAGENKLAQNQSVNGGLNIVSFVLANVPNLGVEPADRIAALPDPSLIVDTLPFTKRGYVNPNQVVYSLVMGSNVGDYDFNWIGLVDADGVLVAVSHIPTIPKRKNVGGIPGNTITRNFLLKYTGIQEITATTVPVETWQIDFGNRLNGIDERERLANLDIYGHEGFLDDGWKVTGSAGTYSVAAGIGYVGGVRAKNTAPQQITTAVFPNEIWLNVSLQGDISDMSAVSEFVIDTGPFEDYVDGNGVEHYLTKIADIDASGGVVDTRAIPDSRDASNLNAGTVSNDRLPSDVLVDRFSNTPGFLEAQNGAARNHFYQNRLGSNTSGFGWIAAAFGDATGNRTVIGQYGGDAIIAAHNATLDGWGDLWLCPVIDGGGRLLIGPDRGVPWHSANLPKANSTLVSDGTDDAAFITAKSLKDADIVPTKLSVVGDKSTVKMGGFFIKMSRGVATIVGDSVQTVTFDTPFPTACLGCVVSTKAGGPVQSDAMFQELAGTLSNTAVQVVAMWNGAGSQLQGITPIVFAWGY